MENTKFRAWLTNESRMIKVSVLDIDNWEVQECLKNGESGHEWIWHTDFELMQFIGFLDKHGKEIYESDWLKEYWEPCGDSAAVSGEYIGEIFYEDAGYWTRSKNHHHALTESCETYEVIGNIYENKELLNGN